MANVTLEVVEKVAVFKDMVEKDAVSIPVRSRKLFTLASMYDANEELLKLIQGKEDSTRMAMVNIAYDYWTAVSKAIPDWGKVKNEDIKAMELRQESISAHSVVLRALGAVGGELMQEDPSGWKGRLLELTNVDWSKKNRDWEGVCIIANSVVSNRQARLATKAYLKRKLKLQLTDSEERALAVTQVTVPELVA
jgi:DNA sulfur modification protein DndB